MKKKIALLLSVLSVVMLLGACGTEDPKKVDYNGRTYDELYKETYNYGTFLNGAGKEQLEIVILNMEFLKENPNENVYNLDPDFVIELTEKWSFAMEESGNYVKVIEDSFEIEKSGKTLTTELLLEFEERDVTFQLVYNYHDMELTGVTIEPVYSMGEKMVKAGMNTIICMSIVFAVLIFISLIISCFKIFPYLEAKKKEKAAGVVSTSEQVVTQIEQREEQQLADDTELVAVIAAAIAAHEGTSTSDFVVRSIRRR